MTSGTRRGTVSIGLSGWQYDGWRGDFYPAGLPKRRWLEHVGSTFPTVELNGSFYSLQRPSRYRTWRDSVPDGFTFAVKGGRYLTHMLRLRRTDTALANFFASGVLELGGALGPILWQLPEDFVPDPGVLDDFLGSLPRTVGAGWRLAALHDDKVRPEPEPEPEPGPSGPTPPVPDRRASGGQAVPVGRGTVPGRPVPPVRSAVASGTRIRYALEVRNHLATTDAHLDVLRRHDVALVDSDAGTAWPRFDLTTSDDLAYLRLHGSPRVYHSGYSPQALGHWASRIVRHRDAGRDVVVYFDNDAERHAPWDALALMRLVARRSA